MKVTVYGAGYVGLVTAVCLAEIGHAVCCLEVDADKVAGLTQGRLPIYEEGLEALLHHNQAREGIYFTLDAEEAVSYGEIHMIAVGTPSREDGSVNLDYIDVIAETIGRYRKTPCFVVNKSTVPPGTAERVHRIIMEAAGAALSVQVLSNPEFLQEGSAIQQCLHPDRILIGTNSQVAVEKMRELYAPLIADTPERFVVMSTRSAELVKYASNGLLATKISFINEMSQIAECVGADIEEVKQGMALDYRINPAFLNAGCGFGGSCFPKDLAGLAQIALDHAFTPSVISAVIERNEAQQRVLFKKISTYFKYDLSGKTIAIWGLAFKPNTDDIRSASSQVLIDALLAAGVSVQAYDPLAMEPMAAHYKDAVIQPHFSASALAALNGADALVIVTEWPEFKNIALHTIYQALNAPVMFDGRNMFAPDAAFSAGFYYSGIGRGQVVVYPH